jgi:septum site-determining protein MinC
MGTVGFLIMTVNSDAQSSHGAPDNGADGKAMRAKVAELLEELSLLDGQQMGRGREDAPRQADADGLDSAETTAEPSSAADPRAPLLNAVKIKGRPGGVAIEIGQGPWLELLIVLQERLEAAEGFFRGGRVVLDVGGRLLVDRDINRVCEILDEHEMKLGVVRSTEERTIDAAVELGFATSTDEVEPAVVIVQEQAVGQATPPATSDAQLAAEIAPAPILPSHFVHRGNLRSGQVLRRNESVVVVGDVNPGAQVISGGDVLVWGRLRGFIHAGAGGNRNAVVTALEFSPTQLRIANLTTVPPETKSTSRGFWFWRQPSLTRAEVAYISDGRIVVEPWDDTKPGGLSALRR